LHQREDRSKNPIPICGRIHIAAQEVENQFWQNRRNQAEREHVEHNRDEDECDGGWACFH
jgi:hypothetical protein